MAQHILVFGVRLYRWVVSPAKNFVFGPLSQCRFTPSCSAYALEAITSHGALLGTLLSLKRIGRCHPWGGCGDDPVPPIQRGPALGSLDRKSLSQPQPSPGPTRSAFAPGSHACRSGH